MYDLRKFFLVVRFSDDEDVLKKISKAMVIVDHETATLGDVEVNCFFLNLIFNRYYFPRVACKLTVNQFC